MSMLELKEYDVYESRDGRRSVIVEKISDAHVTWFKDNHNNYYLPNGRWSTKRPTGNDLVRKITSVNRPANDPVSLAH